MSKPDVDNSEAMQTLAMLIEEDSIRRPARAPWRAKSTLQHSVSCIDGARPNIDAQSHFHVADFATGKGGEEHLVVLSFSTWR